jgi:hypothetical protein
MYKITKYYNYSMMKVRIQVAIVIRYSPPLSKEVEFEIQHVHFFQLGLNPSFVTVNNPIVLIFTFEVRSSSHSICV